MLLLVANIFNLAIDQQIEHKDACYNYTLLSLDWRFEFKANPSLATLLSSCVLSLTFDTNEKEDFVERRQRFDDYYDLTALTITLSMI